MPQATMHIGGQLWFVCADCGAKSPPREITSDQWFASPAWTAALQDGWQHEWLDKELIVRCANCESAHHERLAMEGEGNEMANGDTFTQELPCELTEEELAAKKDELVETDVEIDRLEQEKKRLVSGLNADLKVHKRTREKILCALDEKSELREVECLERSDERRHCVEVIRADTGAIVSERPWTSEEHQMTLPDPTANGAAKKKRGRKAKGAEVGA